MATKRDPRVSIAPAYQAERRRMRRPQHKFNLRLIPYTIQPFMLAPVLPGETLQNLLLQTRAVSNPLHTSLKLIGWWKEYFFFYVKHRDFREAFRNQMSRMMIDPTFNPADITSAGPYPEIYHAGGVTANYTLECMKVVIEEYFRDQGENWDSFTYYGGLPVARLYGRGQNDPFDHMTMESNYEAFGVDITEADTVESLNIAQQQYYALADAGLISMDYEDFIRQYGVQVRDDENSPILHRPELVRHVRQWAYPTNIVEPTNGVPTTAVSWSVAERADKRLLFSEPGFLIGLTIARPKIYLKNQQGSIAHAMTQVQNWLPPINADQSTATHLYQGKTADGYNTVKGMTEGYWIDLRDLFAYGDQFYNYVPAAGDRGLTPRPLPTGNHDYPDQEWLSNLFLDAGKPYIVEDGVVSLGILGRQSPDRRSLALGSGLVAREDL